jgi:hypothetical protein
MKVSTVSHGLPDSILEVVAFREATEGTPAFGDIAHVVGELVREPRRLVDQGRDEERTAGHDHADHEQEGDAGSRSSVAQATTLERLDGWIQRHGQEDGDQDPGQDLPRNPRDVEQEEEPERDPEHGEDRRRAKADDPLFEHRSFRIAARSDVRSAGMVK